MKRDLVKPALIILGMTLFALVTQAREERLLLKMPTSNKINAVEAKKNKKPFFDCGKVKIGDKGNWNSVSSAKHQLFSDVPQSEDAAEDATKAVRCTLKIYDRDKHKMTNADLGEDAE